MKIIISASGISDIVFHATSTSKLVSMLRTGELQLTPSNAIGADSNVHSAAFFLSTTRSRQGHYHRDNSSNSALLQLDGRKLAANFKGGAVDYWGPEYRKRDPSRNEMEDRIFSNKATLPILRYLLSIDLLTPHMSEKDFRFIQILTKKNRIPLRLFDNNKDWVLGRNPQTTLTTFAEPPKSKFESYKEFTPEDQWPKLKQDIYERDSRRDGILSSYITMLSYIKSGAIVDYNRPDSVYDTHKNTAEFKKIYSQIRMDGSSVLGAEMHNAARSQGTVSYKQLVRLTTLAKSMGIKGDAKSIVAYIVSVMDKQRKEYKDSQPPVDDGW
jgi:hypothetical protein